HHSPLLILLSFSSYSSLRHRDLHSFPTRRSSDLLATSGDNRLGGDDFDNKITQWMLDEFRKAEGVDLSKDKMALQRLKEAAEKRSEEHTSELQSRFDLVCRLLLEKKKNK